MPAVVTNRLQSILILLFQLLQLNSLQHSESLNVLVKHCFYISELPVVLLVVTQFVYVINYLSHCLQILQLTEYLKLHTLQFVPTTHLHLFVLAHPIHELL